MNDNAQNAAENFPARDILVDKRFLNLPVKNGSDKVRIYVYLGVEVVREYEVELCGPQQKPDFWVFIDLQDLDGKSLTLELRSSDEKFADYLDTITLDDRIVGEDELYNEQYRPQCHFTSRRGWINDIIGLLYYGGTYHMFYQHNPVGVQWGNMSWGHATSSDLLHWTEQPIALHGDETGTMFSGSGVVDWENTSGLQSGSEKPLVLIYTAAGDHNALSKGQPFTQCIAYSNDSGKTWKKYAENPVLGHIGDGNRDPKVIWHEQSGRWIMALYIKDNDFIICSSKDLKNWETTDEMTVDGCIECPDFFPLAVDGDSGNIKWVFWFANGKYLLGDFDGRKFTPTSELLSCYTGEHAYAGQSFSDIPAEDGRRIHAAWLKQEMPGMPFRHMMTVPVEFTLKTSANGPQLFAKPAKELQKLHKKTYGADADFSAINTELLRIQSEFEVINAGKCGFKINGVEICYDNETGKLNCLDTQADLKPIDGKIKLEILIDRASIEIFANDGQKYIPIGNIFDAADKSFKLICNDQAELVEMEVYELESIWM